VWAKLSDAEKDAQEMRRERVSRGDVERREE
jgi:hypothetical protein